MDRPGTPAPAYSWQENAGGAVMDDQTAPAREGFLYVLAHPSDPMLYKIGVTILDPRERLAQHNTQLDKYAGLPVNPRGEMS
jgi:hypothetical protein